MTKKQEDFANDIENVLQPIIEKHMLENDLKISDIVYVCLSEAEEIALYTKRRNKLTD